MTTWKCLTLRDQKVCKSGAPIRRAALQALARADVGAAEHLSLLEAENDVRHELLKLELQAKRDEAICVRVKARKELLALGVSIEDVDRLMPL